MDAAPFIWSGSLMYISSGVGRGLSEVAGGGIRPPPPPPTPTPAASFFTASLVLISEIDAPRVWVVVVTRCDSNLDPRRRREIRRAGKDAKYRYSVFGAGAKRAACLFVLFGFRNRSCSFQYYICAVLSRKLLLTF